MAKPIPEEEMQIIESIVSRHSDGASISEIMSALGKEIPRRTLTYRLAQFATSRCFRYFLPAFAAAVVSNCSVGGGREGAFVNDVLPSDATIYRAELASPEDDVYPDNYGPIILSVTWNPWKKPVPCSVIREVEYFPSGRESGELALKLVGHTYGGEYFPHPRRHKIHRSHAIPWLDSAPRLLVDTDLPRNGYYDLSKAEAELVASHCGVNFQVGE